VRQHSAAAAAAAGLVGRVGRTGGIRARDWKDEHSAH
jgi:hypothetical protein